MALKESYPTAEKAREALRARGWRRLRAEPPLRSERWARGDNRAALVWYTSEEDGADVVFVIDPHPPVRVITRSTQHLTGPRGPRKPKG